MRVTPCILVALVVALGLGTPAASAAPTATATTTTGTTTGTTTTGTTTTETTTETTTATTTETTTTTLSKTPHITHDMRLFAGRLLVRPPKEVVGDVAVRAWLTAFEQKLGAHVQLRRAVVLDWLHLDVSLPKHTRAGRAAEDATLALVARAQKIDGVRGAAAEWIWRKFATTNDPFREFMWHLDAINMNAAWDITQGNASNKVGVVDSGTAFSHEDLQGKRGPEFDFISDDDGGFRAADGNGRDNNATDPGDSADCGQGPQPSSFHGTHVAGTILASTNNGRGISGINWNAQLVTGRALGRCGGSSLDINEAVAWMAGFQVNQAPVLAEPARPRVINLSLGSTGGPCDDFTNSVWQQVTARGHILVVAAGNDGNNVPVASPANCPSSIAVGAFGPQGRIAPYSNFGPEIDIVAPGGDQFSTGVFENGVLSCIDASVSPFQDRTPYTFYEGTSMAAPHDGVISLMLDVNPSLDRDAVATLLAEHSGTCTNCQGKPALRANLVLEAIAGPQEPTNPGDPCDANGRCTIGQRCVAVGTASKCLLNCTGEGDCAADENCTALSDNSGSVCAADPNAGGGGGGGSGGVVLDDECDVRRGNMDCSVGSGCRKNDDGLGVCIDGADGDTGVGGLCDDGDECSTGLCDKGVCTLPCDDDDCRDGYECDTDVDVPGGLCRPESCSADPTICGDKGFECSYSSTSNYVCAVGPSNYLGACASAPGATAGVGVLGGLLFVLRRRRRR